MVFTQPAAFNEVVVEITGIMECEANNHRSGIRFLALMPINLYGSEEKFHLHNSYVPPAMIRTLQPVENGSQSR